MNPTLWKPHEKATSMDNESLCRPFSESEIKKALFMMETNKAADPDNIPIEFFQSCWEIVKKT